MSIKNIILSVILPSALAVIVVLVGLGVQGCASTGTGGGAAPHQHGQEGKEHPNRPPAK